MNAIRRSGNCKRGEKLYVYLDRSVMVLLQDRSRKHAVGASAVVVKACRGDSRIPPCADSLRGESETRVRFFKLESFPNLAPAVRVLESNNVVFSEIWARLYLYDF